MLSFATDLVRTIARRPTRDVEDPRVAKRTRVKTATNRPGARPASSRPNSLRTAAPRPVSAPLAPAQPMPSEVEATALIITDRSISVRTDAPSGDAAAIARSTPGRLKV